MYIGLFYDITGARLCPECDMNPGKLLCSCKGYRHIGICAHCIAVNHWSNELDLNEIMKDLEGGKRKLGGYRQGVRPALVKEGTNKSITKKKKKAATKKKANKQVTQRK